VRPQVKGDRSRYRGICVPEILCCDRRKDWPIRVGLLHDIAARGRLGRERAKEGIAATCKPLVVTVRISRGARSNGKYGDLFCRTSGYWLLRNGSDGKGGDPWDVLPCLPAVEDGAIHASQAGQVWRGPVERLEDALQRNCPLALSSPWEVALRRQQLDHH